MILDLVSATVCLMDCGSCCLGRCCFAHEPQEVRNSARVDFIKTFITARSFSTRSEHWGETSKYSESAQNLKRSSGSSFANWTLSQHVEMPVFWYWKSSLGVSTQQCKLVCLCWVIHMAVLVDNLCQRMQGAPARKHSSYVCQGQERIYKYLCDEWMGCSTQGFLWSFVSCDMSVLWILVIS